jgi:hypothetical protein
MHEEETELDRARQRVVEAEKRAEQQRETVARIKDMRGSTRRAEELLMAAEAELTEAEKHLADLLGVGDSDEPGA